MIIQFKLYFLLIAPKYYYFIGLHKYNKAIKRKNFLLIIFELCDA